MGTLEENSTSFAWNLKNLNSDSRNCIAKRKRSHVLKYYSLNIITRIDNYFPVFCSSIQEELLLIPYSYQTHFSGPAFLWLYKPKNSLISEAQSKPAGISHQEDKFLFYHSQMFWGNISSPHINFFVKIISKLYYQL